VIFVAAGQGLNELIELPRRFGTRSTVVVLGRPRASSTGMNLPVRESRPLRVVLLSMLIAFSNLPFGRPDCGKALFYRLLTFCQFALSSDRGPATEEGEWRKEGTFHGAAALHSRNTGYERILANPQHASDE
jgi:hypothetical protein